MTDPTPIPAPAESSIPILSMEQVLAIEQKLRENKAAQLRGDPLPHEVSVDDIHSAISSIKRSRGTLDLYKDKGEKKGGGKSSVVVIDAGDI
jgi:hypothetical protein